MRLVCLRLTTLALTAMVLSSCGTASRVLTTATAPVRMITGALLGDVDEGAYGEESPVEGAFETPSERVEIMAFTTEEVIGEAD